MKKLTHLYIVAFLALTLGLMLSCAKKDDGSSSEETDTSSSQSVTVSGQVQKGPYVQGTEITVRELDSTMTPTGNTFTGSIDDNTGSFSIKGTLTNKIAELAADGYYFNEVSGSLSSARKHGVSGVGLSQRGEHKRRFCHIDILSTDDAPRPAIWTYS